VLLSSFISGNALHPLIDSTAELIRSSRDNLSLLSCYEFDPELKNIYKRVDSNDLFIVNELHKARGFRKLHLELARIGSNLQILHCVFFPDPRFNLPIFGVDIVSIQNIVTAAIVDLSPVGKQLPEALKAKIDLREKPYFQSLRTLPAWGSIFSDVVCFIKPESRAEEDSFLHLVEHYLNTLINFSYEQNPDSFESPITIERYQKQKLYCLQQKRNDKTRSVLAKTFTPKWADHYIDIVLFECPPLPKN